MPLLDHMERLANNLAMLLQNSKAKKENLKVIVLHNLRHNLVMLGSMMGTLGNTKGIASGKRNSPANTKVNSENMTAM